MFVGVVGTNPYRVLENTSCENYRENFVQITHLLRRFFRYQVAFSETWILLSSNFGLLMLLQEDDHLIKETASSISGHQQGVKRKADMPLGSPLEPGQILEKNEDSKVKLKIRVRNGNSTCTMCRVFRITAVASAGFP